MNSQQGNQQAAQNDQQIMENILLTTKGACDLYMHGAIESNTQNVHQTFDGALGESLDMQNRIYSLMAAKGWYPSQQADAQQISQVRMKFAQQ
ncbi:MAG TPA: spore coat protein [Candidatus Ventricola intestinavium]|nr:spore coat protein [Candidatus Ventricola intestinavium]